MHHRPTPARARALALLAPLLAGVALSGCTGAADADAPASETRTFEADNGAIEIPADPQRVVATGYAVPVLLEADANLVGISTWERGLAMMSEEDLATYEQLPKVAGENASETNYEAVAEADPDLIIIAVPAPVLGDVDLERLESIAPVAVIGPTLPDAWRELSQRQMDAAGRADQFEAQKRAYDDRAADLRDKYADALDGLEFGHLGAYGDPTAAEFHREVAGSWGTNIGTDIGIDYSGEVAEKTGGSGDVSEYPAIEQLPEVYGDYDVLTYTLEVDGAVPPGVQYVLDNPLWQSLPAVQAGNVFGIQYTEAATYESALRTLDALDAALEPLLDR